MARIIYPQENGPIAIVFPSEDYPLDEVISKTVPQGSPYLILNDDEIPEDIDFRDAWEADFTNPDGYGPGFPSNQEN